MPDAEDDIFGAGTGTEPIPVPAWMAGQFTVSLCNRSRRMPAAAGDRGGEIRKCGGKGEKVAGGLDDIEPLLHRNSLCSSGPAGSLSDGFQYSGRVGPPAMASEEPERQDVVQRPRTWYYSR